MANIDNAFRIETLSLDDITLITSGSVDPTIGAGYEAPIGSLFLRTTGNLYLKYNTADVDWTEIQSGQTIGVGLNNASTGILDGGALSINVDNTKFDITAGVGIIVDNHTDTLNPTAQIVTWPSQTAIAVTNLLTAPRTFIAVNSSGAIIQSTSQYTNVEHKDNIVIGILGHANFTNIVATRNNPVPAFDATARLGDLARAIGPFNVDGNIFSANGPTLQLAKNSGHTYRLGNNFQDDKKDTDTNSDPAEAPVSFIYSYRDGVGGHTLITPAVTSVNGSLWDDGSGTLQVVPSGRWTIQVIKYFSGVIGGPSTRIEYGQQLFSTKQAALDLLPDPNHEPNPAFVDGVIRAYLIIESAATDLTDLASAEIVEAAKFGGSGGGQFSGSITDLQQAYNNSLNPEITTDVTRGALTIKEGATVGGNLITLLDDASTTVFNVDVAGNLTATPLDNLSDVVITSPNNNEILTYSGGQWINSPGGEANTASNIGTAGVGIFDAKIGVDLQFKNINAGSTKVSITDDIVNNEIDIDVNEANLTITESQISDLQSYSLTTHNHTLDSLSDTTITTNTTGEILKWSGTTWINNTLAEAGIASDTHTHAIDDLTDVANTTPADRHVLVYDGVTDNRYENRLLVEADISDLQAYLTDITGESITSLSDVLTTMTPTDGQVLTYDSVNGWQAESPAAGTDNNVAVSDNDTTPGTLIGPTNAKLVAGVGIQFTENNDGGNETLTITNTSPGGVQNIFETVTADTGSIIADTTTDILTLTGGVGIDTTATQEPDTVTFDLNASIDDLNDVVVTTPTTGQVLVYNATGPNWENATAAASDSVPSTTTITNDYTGTGNVVVLVDTSTNAVNVTLPAAASFVNKFYHIKWIAGSTSNKVTVTPQVGETLDGNASIQLGQIYDNLNVLSDGTSWWIL